MSDVRSQASRSNRTRWWVGGVLVLVLAAGAYWYFKPAPGAPADNPFRPGAMGAMKTPVRVAPVEQSTINVVLNAIGTVTAFNTVVVQSRVDGELQKIHFDDGQKVAEGDLLAQIDPRPYQVQLDQALGQQAFNQAQLANARRDLARYQALFKQNSIAKQQVDSQAALVQQYLGTQKSDQAAVDSARLQLSFTKIKAPISGRLGLRKLDQGNLISQASTDGLVVITQTQPISVVFTLPQAQLPRVLSRFREGQAVPVHLYDSTNTVKLADGTLDSIDNQIDVATGTLKLKARFENQDERLFPNQFVNVRVEVSSGEPAIVVPTKAVQQGSKGAFVYRVDADEVVHVQHVTTGVVDGDRIAISSGLEPGQRVVTEGVDRLREGAAVEVVTGDPVAASAPTVGRRPPAGARQRGASPH